MSRQSPQHSPGAPVSHVSHCHAHWQDARPGFAAVRAAATGRPGNLIFVSSESRAAASPSTMKFHSRASRRCRSCSRSATVMPSASRRRLIGGIDHLGQKQKSGAVIVNAEGVAFSKAACFTSLDGVSFADVGWFVHAAHAAAVRTISGTVHVQGRDRDVGHQPDSAHPARRVPPGQLDVRPGGPCTATNGRLQIEPAGVVTVEAKGGAFSNATCFTSLDGARFAP
jgi:hypothetical protein